MSLTRRGTTGWVLLSVTTLLILPISMPRASTEGREFSRCLLECNAAKQSCIERCNVDCKALFPGSSQQQDACRATCKNTCVEAQNECKAVCRAIKDGTSPNEP